MKKHIKYFMDKLSCGISKVKRDNSIEILREPIAIESSSKIPRERSSKVPTERSSTAHTERRSKHYIKYDEMIPGSPEKKHSPQKGNKFFHHSSHRTMSSKLNSYCMYTIQPFHHKSFI